jgi:hypothetical protein
MEDSEEKRNALVGANLCVRPSHTFARTRNRAHTQVRPYGVSSSLSPVRDLRGIFSCLSGSCAFGSTPGYAHLVPCGDLIKNMILKLL